MRCGRRLEAPDSRRGCIFWGCEPTSPTSLRPPTCSYCRRCPKGCRLHYLKQWSQVVRLSLRQWVKSAPRSSTARLECWYDLRMSAISPPLSTGCCAIRIEQRRLAYARQNAPLPSTTSLIWCAVTSMTTTMSFAAIAASGPLIRNDMLSNASDILSASAAQYGDRVAVVDGPRRITYAELLERSESIAALLLHRGVRKGDRVVIFLPRSIDAVTALFAVWIAGGTAVIANEHLRSMQVRHIIEHSDCSLVVTNTRQILAVGRLRYKQVVNIDQVDSLSTSCSAVSVIGADLALLIYTSGSTGLPKGVMLSH